MALLLAASPILTALLAILVLRQSATRSGLAGLAVAIAVTSLGPAFRLGAGELSAALAYGALTTLVVSYVLLGGMILYQVLQRSGALDAIALALAEAVPEPGRQTLILVLGLSVFFESATGFGIGVVVTAPLFVALGHPPARAALLALLGQCAVPWGALGIGTILGGELSGVPAPRIAALGAPLSLPLIMLCGSIALWLAGGAFFLMRRAAELVLYTLLLAGTLAAGSVLVGVELAGAVGGLVVSALGLGISRLINPRGPKERRASLATLSLTRALLPLVLLLFGLLGTRLVPMVRDGLSAVAVVEVPELNFSLALLYHPGFWLVAAAFAGLPWLPAAARDFGRLLADALAKWAQATLAVAGFLCFSQVMYASGMTERLAVAIASAAGPLYVLLIPAVGGLGGFLTASNAGSNALFMQLQNAIGGELALPKEVVAAAQNASGANATLASPGRVVMAASVTGTLGQEATLMLPALALAVAGLAAMALMLWLWIG